jgi:hypothetical protein
MKTGLDISGRDDIIRRILRYFEYHPLQSEDRDFVMDFIGHDKKRRDSGLRFSLLRSPGDAIPGVHCEPVEIIESIDFYRALEQ